MAADESEHVLRLTAAGRTESDGHLYAVGRLVLFAPHGSALPVAPQLNGLRTATWRESGSTRDRVFIAPDLAAPAAHASTQVDCDPIEFQHA
jgi:molybdate transport system substrate-binding protein